MTSAPSHRPVVVGVSETGSARAAIMMAATEAQYRQAPLIAVMAYHADSTLGAPAARPVATLRTAGDQRTAAETLLSDEVSAALGDRSPKPELRVVQGLAGRKLVETAHSAGAQLIVLTKRTRTPALLGTVSQYVLRNAPCPVLVVPDTRGRHS
ncbi:MAG TPA: universal stress protein [Streptosporangiaceae bacterium]|nr:universal stress protein [Streptosporangiaceae bacterium]